jgi:hypothetical protein
MAIARHFLCIFPPFYCFIGANEKNLMPEYNLAKAEVEGSSPFFQLILLFIGFSFVLSHDASTYLPSILFNVLERCKNVLKES